MTKTKAKDKHIEELEYTISLLLTIIKSRNEEIKKLKRGEDFKMTISQNTANKDIMRNIITLNTYYA